MQCTEDNNQALLNHVVRVYMEGKTQLTILYSPISTDRMKMEEHFFFGHSVEKVDQSIVSYLVNFFVI